MPAAIAQEEDLLGVRRPGDAMIERRAVGEPFRLAAGARHQEDLAVHDEGDVLFIGRPREFAGAGREGLDRLAAGLVVGVHLDASLRLLRLDRVDQRSTPHS